MITKETLSAVVELVINYLQILYHVKVTGKLIPVIVLLVIVLACHTLCGPCAVYNLYVLACTSHGMCRDEVYYVNFSVNPVKLLV